MYGDFGEARGRRGKGRDVTSKVVERWGEVGWVR